MSPNIYPTQAWGVGTLLTKASVLQNTGETVIEIVTGAVAPIATDRGLQLAFSASIYLPAGVTYYPRKLGAGPATLVVVEAEA